MGTLAVPAEGGDGRADGRHGPGRGGLRGEAIPSRPGAPGGARAGADAEHHEEPGDACPGREGGASRAGQGRGQEASGARQGEGARPVTRRYRRGGADLSGRAAAAHARMSAAAAYFRRSIPLSTFASAPSSSASLALSLSMTSSGARDV